MCFIKKVYFLLIASFVACSTNTLSPENYPDNLAHEIRFSDPQILSRYDAFYVEPVIMSSNDSKSLFPAPDNEMKDLAFTFREQIIRALGSKVTNFNQPARNVGIIKIKVHDIWSDSALLNLRPGAIVPNTFRGGATMEARFLDSVTKKEFGYVVDSRRGTRQGLFSGLGKWDGAKNAFSDWAKLLAEASEG